MKLGMIRMLNCNIFCLNNLSSIYILHTYLVLLWPLVLFASAFSLQQQTVEAWP